MHQERKNQTETGKAFEYALVLSASSVLSSIPGNILTLADNSALRLSRDCFNKFSKTEKELYLTTAECVINKLKKLEPNLWGGDSTLHISLASDAAGQKGDVRDIIFLRSSIKNWEIGISAKNNHNALKHSRLSKSIDFGKQWSLGQECSKQYFQEIVPIFQELEVLRRQKLLWRDLENKTEKYYFPILNAFKNEIKRMDESLPGQVPKQLVHYLIGSHDFYKAVKKKHEVVITAFNINGTLNKANNLRIPDEKIGTVKLPNKILDFSFKENSSGTLELTCNNGWQLSFRIHNASSKVEPSLKFDVNLIGTPDSLYRHVESTKIQDYIP